MAQRLIEMFLPESHRGDVAELLKDHKVHGMWDQTAANGIYHVTILLPVEETEAVLDACEHRFGAVKEFRLILLPVDASLPAEEEEPEKPPQEETKRLGSFRRISRQELYEQILQGTEVSPLYILLAVLSAVVAAIGLIRGDVAIIIGAMVIAPFLGPNVALALATTLADVKLATRAALANVLGILAAIAVSVAIGAVFGVSPALPQIAPRTQVGLGDIALAVVAGAAGVLSMTAGVAAVLVGVMIAVALLPPMVAFGMLLGAGHTGPAVGALSLLLVYVIGINLAGVTTFLVQGIRPATWWEAQKAKRATRLALVLWAAFLVVFAVVIYLSPFG